jgi:hypothetical protein
MASTGRSEVFPGAHEQREDARQPQPRLLHRVLGVRPRPEHPVGHQAPVLQLERLRHGRAGT